MSDLSWLVPLGLALSGIGGMTALMTVVPFQRWEFEHAGTRIKVRNYAVREVVSVDGVVVKGTWRQGDRLSRALHEVALPGGEVLTVQVNTAGGAVRCRAFAGREAIFDSDGPPWLSEAASAAPAPAAAEPDDPRWGAACVLLADLERGDAELTAAATDLRRALRGGFLDLIAASRAAAAHAALGADDAGDGLRIEAADAAVHQLISTLQELHRAATAPAAAGAPPVPRAREALARIEAEREVQRAAATRASAGREA